MKELLIFLITTFTLSSLNAQSGLVKVDANDPLIHYTGRVDNSNPKEVRFAYPGVSVHFSFEGKVCNIRLKDVCKDKDRYGKPYHNFYNIIIDNKEPFVIEGDSSKELYAIDSLSNSFHTISIFKRTEAMVGETVFKGFEVQKVIRHKSANSGHDKRLKIEFIGNSLTCGYGNEGSDAKCRFSAGTENNYLAYGAISARALEAEYVAVAFSGKGVLRNYDKSTKETMPELYLRTLPLDSNIKWDFKRWTPDFVVMLLGANDFAQGVPDSIAFVNRYVEFVKAIHSNYPKAQIVCAEYPTNLPKTDKNIKVSNYIKAITGMINHHGMHKVHFYSFKTSILDYGCDHHYGLKTHEVMAEELVRFIKTELLQKE